MEYFNGIKPDANALKKLTSEQRRQAIDLGIGAVVRMIYRDGFFHADLHPANLMIFKKPGSKEISVGFIDLGMVGRFSRDMRKRMFYFFYSLVTGDPESAARYLAPSQSLEKAQMLRGSAGQPPTCTPVGCHAQF